MYPLIEGFSSSGMTLKEYAKFHGIKYYTYKYWLRKYRADQKHESSKSGSSNFIPVQITAEKVAAYNFDIVYPNGVQIKFTNSLDTCGIVTLKKLVSCLD